MEKDIEVVGAVIPVTVTPVIVSPVTVTVSNTLGVSIGATVATGATVRLAVGEADDDGIIVVNDLGATVDEVVTSNIGSLVKFR